MILLTALPRTGKTTAIHKIVDMLGILSHVNIDSKYKISRYGVDIDAFENICLEELRKAINDNHIKYIIIDEIGPMELFSNSYKKLLLDLLKCNKQVIGTIYMNSYEWLDDFKKLEGVQLIEITLENRDTIPQRIVDMVKKD